MYWTCNIQRLSSFLSVSDWKKLLAKLSPSRIWNCLSKIYSLEQTPSSILTIFKDLTYIINGTNFTMPVEHSNNEFILSDCLRSKCLFESPTPNANEEDLIQTKTKSKAKPELGFRAIKGVHLVPINIYRWTFCCPVEN